MGDSIALIRHYMNTGTPENASWKYVTYIYDSIRVDSIYSQAFGDTDMDGDIDWKDLRALIGRWLNICTIGRWCGGLDIDRSGRVDLVDFAILVRGWTGSPRIGDFDTDGDIDWHDIRTLIECWLGICTIGHWCDDRDIDRNTRIDFNDYASLVRGWSSPPRR